MKAVDAPAGRFEPDQATEGKTPVRHSPAPYTLPEQLRDRRLLRPDDRFRFGCHAGLSCFTRCCGDANIFLTPVDVLRLARRLRLSTTELLERHALIPITKELHLPVVMLRMGDDEQKRCPFVDAHGCSIYEDRPWSCRMFPLGMGIPPARAGVEPEPVYFLLTADFCEGYHQQTEWTVEGWRANQGVLAQEELEKGYQQLVAHPWFIGGRRLDPKRIEMFYTACYDLDKFRRFIFQTTFLDRFGLEPQLVQELRHDDHALLRFAYRWLRFALFAEPTIAVRDRAATEGRNE
jgi:Fe-S-cluster containining protein